MSPSKPSRKPQQSSPSTPATPPAEVVMVPLSAAERARLDAAAKRLGITPEEVILRGLATFLPAEKAAPVVETQSPACAALSAFDLSAEHHNELYEIAKTQGIDVASYLRCAVARVIKDLKSLSPERAEELVDRALSVGVHCYGPIARQQGIEISTHGLLQGLQLTDRQALNYICRTLMNHSRQVMEMSFNAFDGSRREIAHVLLLAESVCYKAGEDFVVTGVHETEDYGTSVQLFDLLCESVDTYAQFQACLDARRQQAAASAERKRRFEHSRRLAEAERAVETLRAEQSGTVAA